MSWAEPSSATLGIALEMNMIFNAVDGVFLPCSYFFVNSWIQDGWGWYWGWGSFKAEVEKRLSRSLVEIKMRLSWVGLEISWHWINEEIGLS